MDHQTTLNDRPRRDSSVQALTHSLAGIAQDVVKIVELHGRHVAVDLRALRQGALRSLVTWMIACGLLAAALPTALIGTGLWLADAANVSTAAGLLWVASGALVLIIGLFLVGWRQLKKLRVGLRRSRKELNASVAAVRQVLSSHARSASED